MHLLLSLPLMMLMGFPSVTWAMTLVDKPTDVSHISTGYTSMYGDQNMLSTSHSPTPPQSVR